MIKYITIVGLIFTLIAGIYGLVRYGQKTERTQCIAEMEKSRSEAVQEARIEEQRRQKGVNDAITKQYNEISAINANLLDDISKLQSDIKRQRRMPEDSRAECAGTTGAELSDRDATAFIRLAARADKHRAALKSCYEFVDSLSR